ncbi:MAG TPA: iron-sulfur cluster assembly scaffold protein [Terriglobia bacterium]|nr:iron-sulfur cluster assembly scaffold protein [Terriglobia bacterium]
MYSSRILDHFHHPRRAGEIPKADAVVEAQNPVCGDVLKMWVTVKNQTIVEATFKAAGCVPAIACGSWLAEWIQGKNKKEVSGLSPAQIEDALGGLPPASKHAAALACETLKKLLEELR